MTRKASISAAANEIRANRMRPLPNNVGVPPIPYLGSAYLGSAHAPFGIHGDPNDPKFVVPHIGVKDRDLVRLEGRTGLREQLDRMGAHADRLNKQGAFDALQAQAWNHRGVPAHGVSAKR